MTKNTQERIDAINTLKKYLKPGTTVYTSVSNVSSSGMSRHIKTYIVRKNVYTKENEIWNITHLVARVTGSRISEKTYGMVIGGCGMDMGFHVVYSLGRYLFPKGFKTNKKTGARNGADIGSKDNDGGYALQQRWL